MFDFDQDHPECKPDEYFIGNYTKDQFINIGYISKRWGRTTYDIDHKPYNAQGVFPVFVKIHEVEEYASKLENSLL